MSRESLTISIKLSLGKRENTLLTGVSDILTVQHHLHDNNNNIMWNIHDLMKTPTKMTSSVVDTTYGQ